MVRPKTQVFATAVVSSPLHGTGDLSLRLKQDVSGGDSSTLDSLIYLCSRADRDPLLFFTGQVAQLQVKSPECAVK